MDWTTHSLEHPYTRSQQRSLSSIILYCWISSEGHLELRIFPEWLLTVNWCELVHYMRELLIAIKPNTSSGCRTAGGKICSYSSWFFLLHCWWLNVRTKFWVQKKRRKFHFDTEWVTPKSGFNILTWCDVVYFWLVVYGHRRTTTRRQLACFHCVFCMRAAVFVEILMEAPGLLWRSNPWPFSYRHVSPKRRATMLLKNWIVTCTFLTKHPVRSDYLIANKFTAARPRRTVRGSLVPLKPQ